MRHRNAGKKLGRDTAHRKALFRNMAKSLITYERIRTTETKAKELRKVVDKLITLALRNDLLARRQAYKVLGNHGLVKKLFDEIGPRFAGIPGGFTRVVKLGLPRPGDAAPMAVIELTRLAEKAAEKPAEKAEEKAEDKPAKKAPAKKAAKKADASDEAAEAPAKKPRKKKAEAPAEEPAEKPAE
ncbi:MAG: 50S ribosomal protein L17 [Thermodesulfobacteriota bacterium]